MENFKQIVQHDAAPRLPHRMVAALALSMLGCGIVSADAMSVYTNPPFSRYEIILERMPFGVPPPPPPPPAIKQVEQPEVDPKLAIEAFLKQHRMCAMTQTPQGVSVGFIETTERQPKTYFLMVGDSLDGYRVVSADYRAETAVLEKDGETFTLSMDGKALPTEVAAAAPDATAPQGRPVGRRRPSAAGAATPGAPTQGAPTTRSNADEQASYVERLRQRREEMLLRRQEQAEQQRAAVEQEVSERLTGEALQQHLREYNLRLIRARGEMGPPLPMELTPEEDAQLVEEGVLPPAD